MGEPEPDASHGHDGPTSTSRSQSWEEEELQPENVRQAWAGEQSQEVTQVCGAGGERTEELQNVN